MTKATIEDQCKLAYETTTEIGNATVDQRNKTLELMKQKIQSNTEIIVEKNKIDLEYGKENGLSTALLDRLTLTESRLKGIVDSLESIKTLPDPLDKTIDSWPLENGLNIEKISVPFGAIGIIYEARPNVTADAIGLCIKSGNAVVLRGSASAYNSNKVLSDLLREAAVEAGIPGDSIQLLEDVSREGVGTLVKMKAYLSLVIPRGGAALINYVVNESTVPSIETGVGNCHVYIDKDANQEKALEITINAKTQRPSVCNACESILVHEALKEEWLPKLIQKLTENKVEIRGCNKTKEAAKGIEIKEANEEDWSEEYLDMVVSIKVIENVDAAIKHINKYGSMHTEAILSENQETIKKFTKSIDAAAIAVNASTRFTDGGEFGFGAEMGISTQKLHARGPLGLPELTTYKYLIKGDGQIRE